MQPSKTNKASQCPGISTLLITASILSAIIWPALGFSEGTIHLGETISSKEEIINILQPKDPRARKITTRGLQLNSNIAPSAEQAPPQPEVSRSLSLIINFEFDSARLTPGAIEQLQPLGEALSSNELTSVSFTLEGHTDAQGSETYNLSLSNARAVAVKQFLARRYDLSTNRVNAYGKGETELLDESSPFSRENRRVVVIAQ